MNSETKTYAMIYNTIGSGGCIKLLKLEVPLEIDLSLINCMTVNVDTFNEEEEKVMDYFFEQDEADKLGKELSTEEFTDLLVKEGAKLVQFEFYM